MIQHNWTEPRVYTNPDGKPVRVTIYDRDDAREVCTVNLSTHDDPEHVARVLAEFALIAQSPKFAHIAESVVLWDMSKNIGKRKPSPLYPHVVTDARSALAKVGV
jgi:hypothetical protein